MKIITTFHLLCLLSFSLGAQVEPFKGIFELHACDLETDCELIEIDSFAQNLWTIGLPAKPFFDTAFSLPNAILTDTINPYASNNHSYFDLIIPSYNQFYNLILSFQHKYQTDSLLDGGYIEISYDNGASWVDVLKDQTHIEIFNTENMYALSDTLNGGISGFSGTSDWQETKIQWVWQLPVQLVNYEDTLQLRFNFISDSLQSNKAGWMIDDIVVAYADLGSQTAEVQKKQKASIFPNPFSTSCTIRLADWQAGSDYTVKLVNTQGVVQRVYEHLEHAEWVVRREDLNPGLYLVYLQTAQQTEVIGKVLLVE